MSKICPNCLHSVRSGANYCGYCGTSLVPTPEDPAPTIPSAQKEAGRVSRGGPKRQHLARRVTNSRAWLKVPITLLVVVILSALAVRYWPQLVMFLGQALPLLPFS